MGIVLQGKKMILGGKEAYNKFMYNGETLEKKNAKINLKKEENRKKIEEKEAQKAEKKSQKEEKTSILSKIFTKSEEIEIEDGQIVLYGADDEEYTCQMIDLSQLLDEKYKPYNQAPKGVDLLKRDLKACKIFIADDGDIMRVNKILEVKPEEFDENFAYLLFDTNRVYYSIRFKVERSF